MRTSWRSLSIDPRCTIDRSRTQSSLFLFLVGFAFHFIAVLLPYFTNSQLPPQSTLLSFHPSILECSGSYFFSLGLDLDSPFPIHGSFVPSPEQLRLCIKYREACDIRTTLTRLCRKLNNYTPKTYFRVLLLFCCDNLDCRIDVNFLYAGKSMPMLSSGS